jgi:O-antigen ligase/polysaccharide polymerase Wzy-like membrane protein
MKPSTWIPALAIAVIATTAVLTDTWMYVPVAVAGVLFAALAIARPRAAMLLWLALAPIATEYGTVPLPGGIPDITFSRATIVLVGVALLLRARIQGRRMLPLTSVEMAMGALLFVVGADLLMRGSNVASEGLQRFDERITPVLLFLVARTLYTRAGDARRVIWILVLVGVSLFAHGTYQWARASGGPRITDAPESLAREEGGDRTNESHLEQGRAVGPFANAVEYGAVVAIAFGAALVFALHGAPVTRVVAAALLVPLGAAVVISMTRSVWIAAYLAVPLIGWIDRPRRALVLSATAAVTVAGLAALLFLPATSSFRERAVSVEPVSGRLLMYEIAGELALERPLTGYGSGGPSRRAARRKLLARGGAGADLAPGQFHDTFLMTVVEWGLPGLLALVAILALSVRGGVALRRQTGDGDDERRFADVFLFATVVYLVQCLLVDTPPFLYLNGVYFFLAGVVFAQLDARAVTAAERASHPALGATAPAF